MFPYDAQLAAILDTQPQTIADVLAIMQTIDNTCADGDGLKWFNWLYATVTQAVEQRVAVPGQFQDPQFISTLDVQFASLYFSALHASLTGAHCPESWRAMFARRNQVDVARIQFALAGMNAHINHDLPFAVVSTCKTLNVIPAHGTPQYADYTAVNITLDTLIDQAKQTLHVRLLGDAMPPVSHVEDTVAAWNVGLFREKAWHNAQILANDGAIARTILEGAIDAITAFAGKALLIPAPRI